MKGDKKIIAHLNKLLGNELVAINQYFLHARMFKNWGLMRLNDKEYHESIDEMKHADKLAERILFLDGLPNFQALGKLRIGEGPREVLECDLALELDAVPDLREGIAHCESVGDYISRDLLAGIRESGKLADDGKDVFAKNMEAFKKQFQASSDRSGEGSEQFDEIDEDHINQEKITKRKQ